MVNFKSEEELQQEELEQIRALRVADTRVRHSFTFTYNGKEFFTLKELCNENSLDYTLFIKRFNRHNNFLKNFNNDFKVGTKFYLWIFPDDVSSCDYIEYTVREKGRLSTKRKVVAPKKKV